MGQYEKDKKELLEKIEQLEHKLKKAKQSGDKGDVDKYSRKLADRREKLASSASPTASCRTATQTSAGRRANPGIARTASTGRPWAA